MRTRKQYRVVLDRAHGYTAHACRMLPARRTPRTTQRAWSLAQAISARYAAIERRWPVMAFIFEQPDRTGVSVSHTYHTTHPSIFMNPRVILRMLVSHRAEVQRVVADRTPAQPFDREAAPMTLAASPRQKQLPQEHDDIIARIVSRAVRDENPSKVNLLPTERTSSRVAQVAPVENAASVSRPSLARVFRHAPKANDDDSAAAATARTERGRPSVVASRDTSVVASRDTSVVASRDTSVVASRDISATAAVQSPVDITRITDQVIQALDRRIVAHRERMGRG